MTEQNILQVQNLKKSFGDHQVLKDISFSVNKGDVISIIGNISFNASTLFLIPVL